MNNINKKIVKRLILQYGEYEFLQSEIKNLENQKFSLVLKKKNKDDAELKSVNKQLELLQKDLQQVSDEMTFANPIIWIMYKYEAYKNTPKAIKTMYDFRKHCEPDGYICTMRFRFLNKYLETKKTSLHDKKLFPNEMSLKDLYANKIIIDLLRNYTFMKLWKENEYLKTNGFINKWKTVIKI